MKNWLKTNWFKICLIVVVLIIGLNYISYLRNKATFDQSLRQKEYIAKRRKDCYQIFEGERKQWSNTKDVEYDEEGDKCLIRYSTDDWKDKNCEDIKPKDGYFSKFLSKFLWQRYFDCRDGVFTKEF